MSKKKKTIIAAIAGVVAISLLVVGTLIYLNVVRNAEPTLEKIVEGKMTAYETDLMDSLASMKSNTDVSDYFVNWGKNKSIKVTQDMSGNVIYSFKATKGYKEKSPVVIICGFDYKRMELYQEPIVTCLTVAKNLRNHGKLDIVFSPEVSGERIGLDSLSDSYFSDKTQVFYLGRGNNGKISDVTSGRVFMELSTDLTYSEPKYEAAYEVSINNVPVNFSYAKTIVVNPIKTLGTVLANFKSHSMLFELAGISGGSGFNITPESATMQVVVDSSNEDKFERKMNGYIEKFMEKYGEDYPEITYTYKKIDRPRQVISDENMENIISLMYTANNGVYYKDDDGNVVALTGMGEISTDNGKFSMKVSAYSSDAAYLEELEDAYAVIAGLCSMDNRLENREEVYMGNEKSMSLTEEFQNAYYTYTDGKTLERETAIEYMPASVIKLKQEKGALTYCTVSIKTKSYYAGSFITYFEGTDEPIS